MPNPIPQLPNSPITYSFPRYLAAKKTVDDRALNQHVWQMFTLRLPPAPRILEVGAGIGTMVERLWECGVLAHAHYTALDALPENMAVAQQRLAHLPISLQLETADLFHFIPRQQNQQPWDALIAHAFLDLVNIPATLPLLFSLLRPGGLFYFTINFDGATILQPTIDPPFDALVEQLYHRTMDERLVHGLPSGDSHSGRHLFHQLQQAGGDILAAGSSDWVVFGQQGVYPADEAYFLHFIIHTMQQALQGHPELENGRFAAWIAQRHAQIEAGELVYIAHQLDFVGKRRET